MNSFKCRFLHLVTHLHAVNKACKNKDDIFEGLIKFTNCAREKVETPDRNYWRSRSRDYCL